MADLTVGELRAMLRGVPDDLTVVVTNPDGSGMFETIVEAHEADVEPGRVNCYGSTPDARVFLLNVYAYPAVSPAGETANAQNG